MITDNFELNPINDSKNDGQDYNSLCSTLSDDPNVVGPSELQGATISDAESHYIGVRRAEENNHEFTIGTKRGRASAKFSRLMDIDRVARIVFDEPVVGMQTLVFDPKKALCTLTQDVIGPVEQAQIVTNGVERAIRRTRDRLTDTGNQFVYYAVRDMDTDGLSHWHVYWCVDNAHVDADSLDLLAGVESHIRHVPGATDANHPSTEAVKWDPYPAQTVEAYGDDLSHGGPVHPLARYVASSLPHFESVEEMDARAVRHGTIEWSTTSKALKDQKRNAIPVEIRRLSSRGLSQ